MEKLIFQKETCEKALHTLQEILQHPNVDPIVRDATIQRFEYTFETAWKLVKIFLFEVEGLDCNSPKSCFREALKAGLLDPQQVETAIRMTNDRNMVSHTYIEAVAGIIYSRIPEYAAIIDTLCEQISSRL